MSNSAIVCQQENFVDSEESGNIYAWVYPPSPATGGVVVIMNDECALEMIDMIRHDCTNEDGSVLEGKRAAQMMQFATRLEQNIAQKKARKSLRKSSAC